MDKSKANNDNVENQADDSIVGENVNALSEESLNSLDISDDGSIVQKTQNQPEADDGTPTPGDGHERPADESGIPGDDVTDGEGDEAAEPETVPFQRFKDTRAAYQRQLAEKQKLLKENQDMRLKIIEHEKPKEPKQYTREQLDEIREDDPDLYHRILSENESYDERVKAHKDRVEEADKAILAQQKEIADAVTMESIVSAVSELAGTAGRLGVPFEEQPDEFKNFITDEKFTATFDHIDKYPSRYREPDGSLSKDTIMLVYRGLNTDAIQGNARREGRSEAVDAINRAKTSQASNLGRATKDDGSGKKARKISELKQADFADMSEDELNAIATDAETQGLL